jgi:hypothetical protein
MDTNEHESSAGKKNRTEGNEENHRGTEPQRGATTELRSQCRSNLFPRPEDVLFEKRGRGKSFD